VGQAPSGAVIPIHVTLGLKQALKTTNLGFVMYIKIINFHQTIYYGA